MVTDDNKSFKLLLISYAIHYMQPLNRQETEDLIVDLYYKQKKTFREIQKIVRKSPRDIRTVLNKVEPERSSLSESSQAYKMFTEGMTPIQVAVVLGLEADRAIHLHQEYYKLLGCTEFTKVYSQIRDNPWPYVNLVKQAQNAGMSDNEVLELLRIANKDLPRVRLDYDRLKEEKNSLEANVKQSERTLQEITDRTSKESRTLEHYRSICNQIKEETKNLNTKKARLETAIDSFQNNNEVYIRFRQMIKQDIESLISNPRRLLEFALVSIFDSARKHPGKLHAMYYNMPTIRTMRRSLSRTPVGENHRQDDHYEPYVSQYATDYDTSKSMLLYEAELLYNQMIEESVNMCSNEMTSNTESSSLQSLQPLTELPAVEHGQAAEEDHYSNSDAAEPDLLTNKVACDNTDPQIQRHEENNVDVTKGYIQVGKNEIRLRI
ncbi:MAG: hypothetical protein WA941_15470 [Nitrososphaeraceae archaeon]